MTLALSEARCDALSTLQSLRDRRDTSSIEYDVADHALSLAMSPSRDDTRYLARDCLRNARSIVVRSRRRSREGGVDFLSPAAAEGDPAELVAAETPDPFERALWRTTYAVFVERIRALGRDAERALAGMVEDEPVERTAREAGMSPRKLKSLRAQIRRLAGDALARAVS